MKIVIFGLGVSSAWGNGHATLWRGLIRELAAQDCRIVFFEKDVPYYAAHRDFTGFPDPRAELILYRDWPEAQIRRHLQEADIGMVTSYCPDAQAATRAVLSSGARLKTFYDLDSPITLERLRAGQNVDYLPPGGLGDFDLVLSYTGGPALQLIRQHLGARRVVPLYGSVDPQAHFPVPSRSDYLANLSYLGTYAPDRQPLLERLLLEPARRLPHRQFLLGGPMYPADFRPPANVRLQAHVAPPEHPAFYCSSDWTLNLTRKAMAELGFCPSARLFEAACCGVPLLTDSWPGLELFFEPGHEITVVGTSEQVLGALQMRRSQRLSLAAAARERVLAEHTAAHRAEEFLEICSKPRREVLV